MPCPEAKNAHHEATPRCHLRASVTRGDDHSFVAHEGVEEDRKTQEGTAPDEEEGTGRGQEAKVERVGERNRLWAVTKAANQTSVDQKEVERCEVVRPIRRLKTGPSTGEPRFPRSAKLNEG